MENNTTSRFLWLYDELLIRGLIKNAKDLAAKAKISPGNITNIRKGRNGLGTNDAEKFLIAFPEVNRTWFQTGKGDPFNKSAVNNDLRHLEKLINKYGLRSLSEQIMELKSLMEAGIITKAEFNQGKRKILR